MITFSAQEIVALLLEIDKNELQTDSLITAQRKLRAEYKRISHVDANIGQFTSIDGHEQIDGINEFQDALISGYYAIDPSARLLGYYKRMPVIQAFTAPLKMRSPASRPTVVVVTRDGSAKRLPFLGWADGFIPADSVTWAEAETVISEWHARHQAMLRR